MSLEVYRNQIDKIDDTILDLMERRELATKMIDKIKKKKNEDITIEDRKEEILERLCENKSNLKKNKIINLFNILFKI